RRRSARRRRRDPAGRALLLGDGLVHVVVDVGGVRGGHRDAARHGSSAPPRENRSGSRAADRRARDGARRIARGRGRSSVRRAVQLRTTGLARAAAGGLQPTGAGGRSPRAPTVSTGTGDRRTTLSVWLPSSTRPRPL